MLRNIVKPLVVAGEKIFYAITQAGNAVWALWDRTAYRVKVTFENKEAKKLFKNGGVILIANHTAHKDGSFAPHVLGIRKTRVLVTRKWYNKKLIYPFFKALDYIPINLNDTDTEWEAVSKRALYAGKNVLIFPEGELEKRDEMLPFLPGFLILARHSNAPILPVAIKGGYTFGKRVTVKVGVPLDFDPKAKGRPSVLLKQGAELYRDKIIKMLED